MQGQRQKAQNVVIVGGGFGGLYTALALAQQKDHPPVLLIEPNDRFLFLPLLYELLSGELRRWEIAPRYDGLLAGRGVAWLQDRVERIDADHQQLHTAAGRTLSFGRLVIATGAQSNTFAVPGADRHSLGFRSLADVERLQCLVADLKSLRKPLQRIAVVGAGPTGVELACKLADMAEGSAVIELIEQGPQLLPQSRAFNREQAALALRRRDVRLRTRTRVQAVEAEAITLQCHPDGDSTVHSESLAVRAVVWTAGLSFAAPRIDPAPACDSRGRLLCGPDLCLQNHGDLFVAGDLAAPVDPDGTAGEAPGAATPATAQVAFQQASVLATNLIRSLRGEPLEPFQWNDLGEMMSLGVGEASLTAAGVTLAGPAAYQLRRLAYLARLPGRPHQLRVAAGWLADWKP
ncbi:MULTISPECIES: NAD(P)/FAD-dependent oxidoreductase [unclassified Cyanobium]|uniref:NAD(P)/FAD-dependent oxidoreductase n=1 Tax=unclassified Cyanobium TaxID=2627006 RepID=UPI0020CDD603|nr:MULTISPECIES: FAD-dependent oxidoreductase [unclassified Cyanobium]MCP9860473.1 FAD-dependent oxidoreductase [Cyanobium sp. Cruz-8H5]MCP9867743.1 FAD-dependent oxidoreductase [Cyanobium sp. Cruz-8D1]